MATRKVDYIRAADNESTGDVVSHMPEEIIGYHQYGREGDRTDDN